MLGSLLGGLVLAACVVSEEFDDAQFLCDPQGGDGECPSGMSCSADGLCRHSVAKPDGSAGTAGKDGSGDGSCFPKTCESLAPKCGLIEDGCGSVQQCGCTAPDTCGGGGKTGECGCTRNQSRTGQPGAAFEDKPTGSVSWQSHDDARLSNDQWATASLNGGQTSAVLKLVAFDFPNMPAVVNITGVEIAIERSAPGGAIKDQAVRLLVGGNPTSTVANKNIAWQATDSEAKYGSATDLWGATSLDLSQVKDPQFGVALSVTAAGADTARVDAVKLTVFFEDPSCPVQQ